MSLEIETWEIQNSKRESESVLRSLCLHYGLYSYLSIMSKHDDSEVVGLNVVVFQSLYRNLWILDNNLCG